MDEGRFNLSKLTEKVRSYLEESLPRLTWVKEFKGGSYPKCSDRNRGSWRDGIRGHIQRGRHGRCCVFHLSH